MSLVEHDEVRLHETMVEFLYQDTVVLHLRPRSLVSGGKTTSGHTIPEGPQIVFTAIDFGTGCPWVEVGGVR